jgi:hypothetical protein
MANDPPTPQDVNEVIAKTYLDDRDAIRKGGEGIRTTAKWMMSAIGGVAAALSGGAAVFSNLGHLSGNQRTDAYTWVAIFLLGVAASIFACSTVLASQTPTANDPRADKFVEPLGLEYAGIDELRSLAESAPPSASSEAGQFLRHHAALQKVIAQVWFEKLSHRFGVARWFILLGSVIAGFAFVHFIELTEASATNADAPTKTADLAKTRAETRKTQAETRQIDAQIATANSGGSADALVAEAKLERKEAARLRAEATRMLVEATRLSAASDTDE